MTVREVGRAVNELMIEADLRAPPARVFDFFVDPALLERWWPTEAEVFLYVGGYYVFSWPAQGWTLRGRYTLVEPGRALGFTWQWDHEPDMPARKVDIELELTDGGTLLRLVQGPFGTSATEQEDRESHRHGWLHFLDRLAAQAGNAG